MIDLGPHAAFIFAAYGVTFVAVAALASFIIADDRRQRRLLDVLERKGIRRRSAGASAKALVSEAAKRPRRRRP
jgi:heme exporter protein D